MPSLGQGASPFTVSWPHSLLPRVWLYMATQLRVRSPRL